MGSVFFAFFLMMAAGGLIAYFGDRLGYVMGKKRVTLFGLRPRDTASALTIVSGVVIGALALGFAIVVNKEFRTALLYGAAEIRLNLRLRQTNRALQQEVDADRAVAKSAKLFGALAQSETRRARSQLNSAEWNLEHEEAKAIVMQETAASTQRSLLMKQSELARLSSDLTAERTQLAEVQSELKTDSQKEVAIRRSRDLIFRNYGELGRQVIAADEAPNVIRAELVRFLNRESQIAMAKGAVKGDNGRAVVVASLELLDQKQSGGGDFIDENGSLNALASAIHTYNHGAGSVVVIASALGNSFVGEQVIVVLRPFANVLVLRSGTEICQTTIADRTPSVDSIVGQLQQFLVMQVRPAAIKAGMIPVRNPVTGKVELGDITVQQIYDIVNQIKQIGAPAIVSAVTTGDVYSADELELSFTVRPEVTVGG